MDFLTDLKDLVQGELSRMGHTGKPDDDLDKLLLRYHNVRARIPRQVSWEVKVSKEVSNKLSRKVLKASEDQGLKQFIRDAEEGKDLGACANRLVAYVTRVNKGPHLSLLASPCAKSCSPTGAAS